MLRPYLTPPPTLVRLENFYRNGYSNIEFSMKSIGFCLALAAALLSGSCGASSPESPETTAPTSSDAAADTGSTTDTTANFPDMVQTIHAQINQFRQSQGLEPLTLDPVISTQARQHSQTMTQTGTLSHDGFEQRVEVIRQQLALQSAAENVGTNQGYDNPAQQAVEGWQNSPGHRQNILGDFSQTGIGIAQDDQGQYYFTQIFVQP